MTHEKEDQRTDQEKLEEDTARRNDKDLRYLLMAGRWTVNEAVRAMTFDLPPEVYFDQKKRKICVIKRRLKMAIRFGEVATIEGNRTEDDHLLPVTVILWARDETILHEKDPRVQMALALSEVDGSAGADEEHAAKEGVDVKRREWLKPEEETLRALVGQGFGYKVLTKKLDRGKPSVSSKVHELGLRIHPQPKK